MKIVVPTSLADIKLSTYLRYLKVVEECKEEQNKIVTNKIMIFCDLKEEEVKNIDYEAVTQISSAIDLILASTPIRKDFIKLGKINFGWLPSLDDLGWGEFLDLNNNISSWETIHIALGVLYRPVTMKFKGKYTVEKYKGDKYHHLIKDMPMNIVVSSMVFFWNLGMDCGISTMRFLAMEQVKMETMNNLMPNMVGTEQSMNLLVETLQNLKKSTS